MRSPHRDADGQRYRLRAEPSPASSTAQSGNLPCRRFADMRRLAQQDNFLRLPPRPGRTQCRQHMRVKAHADLLLDGVGLRAPTTATHEDVALEYLGLSEHCRGQFPGRRQGRSIQPNQRPSSSACACLMEMMRRTPPRFPNSTGCSFGAGTVTASNSSHIVPLQHMEREELLCLKDSPEKPLF